MIEAWQYVVLGGVAAIALAIGMYQSRRSRGRDDAFFAALETAVTDALAAQGFVLTSRTHTPKSFDSRSWHFERPPRTVRVFWDGRDRELVVELRDDVAATPVRERTVISGPAQGGWSERYLNIIDEVLDAL